MSLSPGRLYTALIAESRASPAKAAVLLVGFALLVALVARLALRQPASADAAQAGLVAATATAPTVPGADDPAAARPKPRIPRPALAQTLRRDLFAAPWVQVPPAESSTTAEPEKDQELVLQFTLLDGSGPPRAVISGAMVKPGSRIGTYVVVRIERRAVVLKDQVQEITLRMP